MFSPEATSIIFTAIEIPLIVSFLRHELLTNSPMRSILPWNMPAQFTPAQLPLQLSDRLVRSE
jgi:hypothetical protein